MEEREDRERNNESDGGIADLCWSAPSRRLHVATTLTQRYYSGELIGPQVKRQS